MREMPANVSTAVALLALGATVYSAYTSHASLRLSEQTEQISLFNEFQNEYATIAAAFPPRLLAPDFHPARGTDDYNRLQAYWIFAYAEWFATNRLAQGGNHALWTGYYQPLVLNAMEVPSLRFVLIDMMGSYGGARPQFQQFYHELAAMAAAAHEPLAPPPAAPSR